MAQSHVYRIPTPEPEEETMPLPPLKRQQAVKRLRTLRSGDDESVAAQPAAKKLQKPALNAQELIAAVLRADADKPGKNSYTDERPDRTNPETCEHENK